MPFQQCELIMLPTDKADGCLLKGYISLQRHPKQFFTQEYLQSSGRTSEHLYILSNDKIKEGDWFYCKQTNTIQQCFSNKKGILNEKYSFYKKIIATTDKSLNLPQIPEWFIEYLIEQYNKSNKITYVNVEYETDLSNSPYTSDEYNLALKALKESGNIDCNPKINDDNTINIQLIKPKSLKESFLEAHKAYLSECLDADGDYSMTFIEWIEKNLQ